MKLNKKVTKAIANVIYWGFISLIAIIFYTIFCLATYESFKWFGLITVHIAVLVVIGLIWSVIRLDKKG